jgi:RHS repeat-associated protein
MILVDGGYVKDGQYHFFLQDHLGSNRVVADANGNVVQATHYYPYGMPFAESYAQDVQKRKYIGKELDTENGLNLYDYDKRMQDGLQFISIDPMAEKYYSVSPYAYCMGNPVNYVDLRGDTITTTIDGKRYYWGKVGKKYGFIGTDGALYSGKNEYAKSLTKALNSLRKKEVGRKLVNSLANSKDRTVDIKDGESNSAYTDGSTILWNEKHQNKDAPRPSFIGLGHEMAHIQDQWNGTLSLRVWHIVSIPKKGDIAIRNAEKYATHIENQIRAEHNIPLRTHYYHEQPSGIGYPPSSIINPKDNSSLFYTNGLHQKTVIINGVPSTTTTELPFKYKKK